jgi:hypothetical protein
MKITFDTCEKKHCDICLLSVVVSKQYSGASTTPVYVMGCSLRSGGHIEGDDILNKIIMGKIPVEVK